MYCRHHRKKSAEGRRGVMKAEIRQGSSARWSAYYDQSVQPPGSQEYKSSALTVGILFSNSTAYAVTQLGGLLS